MTSSSQHKKCGDCAAPKQVKVLPVAVTSYTGTVQVPAATLLIQLTANVPGMAQSPWASALTQELWMKYLSSGGPDLNIEAFWRVD